MAHVVPVFKADDPTVFGNYQPISVPPVFSKVFEGLIQCRLLQFLGENSVIINGQYGFRRKHSTCMAIVDIVEKIRATWEGGESCLGIFIDFRKAFDTVDHDILIEKMGHLGIRGVPLELMKSYLNNRKQYVVYNGEESSQRDVTVGVPQGSILGPLFFLLYVNDLAKSSRLLEYILFADDTNIFASDKDKGMLYDKVNVELGVLSDWFACNKLTLNYDKTEFIDFSKATRENTARNFTLSIDGSDIKKVAQSKFLGVRVDNGLSWRTHIGIIIRKIRQTMGIIGRARSFMAIGELLKLYNTMVLPHLQYCIINWGNFKGDGNLKLRDEILATQKSLMRIITGSPPRSHADPLFSQLGVLKVDDLFTQSVRMFAFKAYKNSLPIGMQELFDRISVSHNYNTRGAERNFFLRGNPKSIKYLVPSHWNSLPVHLKDKSTVSSFKKGSKDEYLTRYSSFRCSVRNCYSCLPRPVP